MAYHRGRGGPGARRGVGYVWLVDPQSTVIEVLELTDAKYLVLDSLGGFGQFSAPPFDVLSVDMAALWETGSEQHDPL